MSGLALLGAIGLFLALLWAHEVGHLWAARAFGVPVRDVVIGLGPTLVSWRRSGTRYRVRTLPFGAHIAIGEHGDDWTEALRAESWAARLAVLLGGVVTSLGWALLAFTASAAVFGIGQPYPPRVDAVTAGDLPRSAAGWSAVAPGTRITQLGARRIEDWKDLEGAVWSEPAGPVSLVTAARDTVTVTLPEAIDERLALKQALIGPRPPVIGRTVPGLPAGRAGLRAGDSLVAIDGEAVERWDRWEAIVEQSGGETLSVVLVRDGNRYERTVPVRPGRSEFMGITIERGYVGAMPPERRAHAGPLAALRMGGLQTGRSLTIAGRIAHGLVTGSVPLEAVGGPAAAAEAGATSVHLGARYALNLFGLLSVNLALLNLLPLASLDGGHLLVLIAERIRGRPLEEAGRQRWRRLGLAVLAALFLFTVLSDALRLG